MSLRILVLFSFTELLAIGFLIYYFSSFRRISYKALTEVSSPGVERMLRKMLVELDLEMKVVGLILIMLIGVTAIVYANI